MSPVTAQDMTTAIPDLRDVALDQLAEDGTTVLADAIRRYRERLAQGGVPRNSFSGRI
jgi:hypothetical protein